MALCVFVDLKSKMNNLLILIIGLSIHLLIAILIMEGALRLQNSTSSILFFKVCFGSVLLVVVGVIFSANYLLSHVWPSDDPVAFFSFLIWAVGFFAYLFKFFLPRRNVIKDGVISRPS